MGYSYCPVPANCPNYNSSRYQALQYCRTKAVADCAIYAIGKEIVWKGSLPWDEGYWDPSSPRLQLAKPKRKTHPPIAFTPEARGEERETVKRRAAMCNTLPDDPLELGRLGYDRDTDLKYHFWEECERLGLKSRQ